MWAKIRKEAAEGFSRGFMRHFALYRLMIAILIGRLILYFEYPAMDAISVAVATTIFLGWITEDIERDNP